MGSTREQVKTPAASADRGEMTKAGQTHARRWYHPRPQPRCRADVAGFNYSYWVLFALLLIIFLLP